jgi:hypothetical protein
MIGVTVQVVIGLFVVSIVLQTIGVIVQSATQWLDTLPRPMGVIMAFVIAALVLAFGIHIVHNITTP